MFAEIIQLNKLYKTNKFAQIKAKLYKDKLIFLQDSSSDKLGTVLTKLLDEEREQFSDQIIEFNDILSYFELENITIESQESLTLA